MKGTEMGNGLWVVSKDIKDRLMLMEAYKLMVCGRSPVIRSWECSPRSNTSSAKQRRGLGFDPLLRTRKQAIMLARNLIVYCEL